MGPRGFGPLLMVLGLLLVLIGVLAWSGALSWFGHLPGDIRIEGRNVRVYIPWVSLLVLSAGISVLLFLVSLLRR